MSLKQPFLLAVLVALATATSAFAQSQTRYVRYETGGRVSWGILDGETTIRELSGSVFGGAAKPTGRTLKLAEVKLLPPAEAKKVIAAGFNYKSASSHRRNTSDCLPSSRRPSSATTTASSIRQTPASSTTKPRSAS
jgi:hypothetical protein